MNIYNARIIISAHFHIIFIYTRAALGLNWNIIIMIDTKKEERNKNDDDDVMTNA